MARLPIDKARMNRIGGDMLARYIRYVYRTSTVVTEPQDLGGYLKSFHPIIMAMWHGQFMMLPKINPGGIGVRIMVARHGDAQLIGEALTRFDMELIRGAGAGNRQRDRGGAQALREAMRSLEDGYTVAMTADVPPGPARRAGAGIVTLARMSGRPIIPAAVATTRYRALDTWSRFTINLPYGRLAMVAGNPITVSSDADEAELEAARRAVEAEMNRVTLRAYELAGADPSRTLPALAASDGKPDSGAGMRLGLYRAVTRAIQPMAPAFLRLREMRGKEDARRRGERLGYSSAVRPDGVLVWMHAASVGEANVVLPLMSALRARQPDLKFLLTTGTTTSAALAASRLGSRDIHQYVPLDAPEFVARFLDHWSPDLAIFAESEIWPNLIVESARRGVRLALVNGRLSNRSYNRWRRSGRLARALFGRFDVVLAQNEKLGRWFESIGARRVVAVGNLKVDAPSQPANGIELQKLADALAGRRTLVAASTHDGEEAVLAAAHRMLAQRISGFCTIVAPRHPDRGTAIAEQMRSLGLRPAQRSLGALPTADCDVYIADTIGELGTLFRLSPIAFLGKSLVEGGGGQNPIEAIKSGAAVLTGPHWSNFRDAYKAILRHKGAIEVRGAEDIANATSRLIEDEAELLRLRAGANAAVGTLSGALSRTVDALLPLLPEPSGLRRAS